MGFSIYKVHADAKMKNKQNTNDYEVIKTKKPKRLDEIKVKTHAV